MTIAALILGILGGVFGLGVGFFGFAVGGIAGATGAGGAAAFQTISMAIPIAALVGGGLAISKPMPAGILMLASAVGMFLVFGFNFFTALAIVLTGLGGLLALGGQSKSATV